MHTAWREEQALFRATPTEEWHPTEASRPAEILLVNPPSPDGDTWIRCQHRAGQRALDGTVSIQQPLIEPLHGGLTAAEVVARISGYKDQRAYDIVRNYWRGRREFAGSAADFARNASAAKMPDAKARPRSATSAGRAWEPAKGGLPTTTSKAPSAPPIRPSQTARWGPPALRRPRDFHTVVSAGSMSQP